MQSQLETEAKRFCNETRNVNYDKAGKKVKLSMIFKWYGEDFATPAGGTEAWLAARSALLADTPAEQARIASGAFKLGYQPYDWRLNDRRPPGR